MGPGMLTECSQCQGQTSAEADVLSTGAEPWNSSGSVGETGELGSKVGGSGTIEGLSTRMFDTPATRTNRTKERKTHKRKVFLSKINLNTHIQKCSNFS